MLRILVAALVLIQTPLVLADAQDEIDYRQGVYRVVGGHMKAMSTAMRKGVYTENIAVHAKGMKDIASVAAGVFPASSSEGKTKALPAIWEQPDAFKEAMDKFVTAANGIATAVESGDQKAIGGAMRALGGSCKNCHDNFKAD